MAAPAPHTVPVGADTLITVKVIIDGINRRFKLALRDLGAHVLPQKLRFLLAIPPEAEVTFQRFSDSAGSYITLDSNNPAIYKQLYRAAKAKLKLRLKATIKGAPTRNVDPTSIMDAQVPAVNARPQTTLKSQPEARQSYLETVLSTPLQPLQPNIPTYENYAHYPPRNSKILNAPLGLNNVTNESLFSTMKVEAPREMSRATLPSFHDFPSGSFCIDCNNCGASIPNEHYHCSICDSGDFDLCQGCVEQDVTCDEEGHWLIKRSIRDGMVISSVTETLAPKVAKLEGPQPEDSKQATSVAQPCDEATTERTCNCCIRDLPGNNFVTCVDCPDFDLCFTCFSSGEHGHHPAHQFQPVDEGNAKTTFSSVLTLCQAGRGVKHAAICDGCDKNIVGVRHKCLSCPDWDFCSTCVLSASETHPGHRFAPLYETIPDTNTRTEVHCGIYCDGPLCASRRRKAYIRGDRYKCAVCHDTDFCASCEAVPTHDHNRTHPLIKFKTPVRHVSVTTLGENNHGEKMSQMGDIASARNASTETVSTSANAASQVQTVAEVKPFEPTVDTPKSEPFPTRQTKSADLQAWFESDSTPDGSRFAPNRLVSQSWTLRNPGPHAWPAGCAVYYVGGDDMRNLDANHPSSVTAITSATQSNVLEQSVGAGKPAAFTVLLKSPPREGRAISYWRLKTPQGVPFGHKLWVDITVTAPVDEQLQAQTASLPTVLSIHNLHPEQSPTLSMQVIAAIPDVVDDEAVAEPEGEQEQQIVGVIEGSAVAAVASTPATTEEDIKLEEKEENEESSTMIFPKLEKESPGASFHEVSESSVPTPVSAPATCVSAANTTAEQELLEDMESLELEDEDTDDGFLTDEEYDILDASDEDPMMEAQKHVKK